jgi:2-keto-4-pentenoate hydratase/2-oxohepta-3-ene-1,7-dioic acid hydratase in catechol pathway
LTAAIPGTASSTYQIIMPSFRRSHVQWIRHHGERVAASDSKLLGPGHPAIEGVARIGSNYAVDRDELEERCGESRGAAHLQTSRTRPWLSGRHDRCRRSRDVSCTRAELVIVIGKIAKRVKAADYADVIFGYNNRQRRSAARPDVRWMDSVCAKGYDTFAPPGPVIETELDWSNLEIQTHADGRAAPKR